MQAGLWLAATYDNGFSLSTKLPPNRKQKVEASDGLVRLRPREQEVLNPAGPDVTRWTQKTSVHP